MSISFASSLAYADVNLAYRITIFAIWGIGVDIPRILIRYGRSYPPVQNIHAISMLIISLLTIMYQITWTSVYYQQTGVSLAGAQLGAFIVGWILVGAIFVQMTLGFITRAQINRLKLSYNLFVVKSVHRYLGWAMSILGKIMVALLLNASSDQLFRGWLFIFGAILIMAAITQWIYKIQSRKCMWKFPLKHTSKYQKQLSQILQNINSNKEDFPDYKQRGVRYVVFDNDMYYIDEQFMHPGGEAVFTMFNGQEVNYLFRGTHGIAADYPRHKHTKYAANYLQMRYVGKINTMPLLLTQKVADDLIEWRIRQIIKIAGDGHIVTFETQAGYVDDSLRIDQFGKYSMIRCPSEDVMRKIWRPYTLLRCLSHNHMARIQRLKQNYKYYVYGESGSIRESGALGNRSGMKMIQNIKSGNAGEFLQESAGMTQKLLFMIKSYKYGSFTNFLLKSKGDKYFQVTGPYGRGLRLKPQSKGLIVIMAAGTGILPFMDLFVYLLQRTLANIIRDKAGQSAFKRMNQQNLDYSGLQGLRVLFIGSFQTAQHFYMEQIVKDLYHLNKKHQLSTLNTI